jgi:outer membrane protein, multidrug efflux system
MGMRKVLLALPLVLLPRAVGAQTASGPAPAPSASSAIALPPPPPVSDPMLVPVPPAKRLINSWKEAIDALHARSTDLRVSVDQVLQAEAATRIALAAYLPQMSGISGNGGVAGSYTHQLLTNTVANPNIPGLPPVTTIPIANVFGGSIQVQQNVVNVQLFDQISINELMEDQARMSVDAEKRTLALSIANQIVAVVTAERSAEINRVGLRVALEQVEIASRKRALGAATGLDVVRAQQNAANARATLVTGDESLREAREAFGLALGYPEEVGVGRDVNINGLADGAMATCRAVPSVYERPDVATARLNLRVAQRNLQNVWYQFLPTVYAQSTMTATSVPNTGYPNPTWNIQAVLSINLFDGGTRYGNLRNARAAEDIAAQQLESARRQAVIQVEQAQRQFVVSEESYRVAKEQRDLAAQNDVMTQTAYMTGQGTSLELVTASEAHRQAELNLALQEFTVVKARILAALALATCPW